MPIDTSVPYSDGWTLDQLYRKLRKQQRHAEDMDKRYRGDPPLPAMNDNQVEATKWFIKKARTNFEKLIVEAVISRLRIRGIRTAVDNDEGGDAEAFDAWKRSRGKLWSKQAHEMSCRMGISFVMVGKDKKGKLLVTAEDPRQCVVMTDPADPLRVTDALKLTYDAAKGTDVARLFRLIEGEDGIERVIMRVASRNRSASSPIAGWAFDSSAFDWVPFTEEDGETKVEAYEPEWLQETDDRPAMLPIVPFENRDGMAEFEPHLELLDRITQQILQRMTIATIQAFKQRAMKGLPENDPETGEKIDYDNIFTAEPGAIWNIPAAVEIWESGQADLQGILLSIRDDVKDLAAVSGTPLYTVTPDVANGSAEGASLQRETMTFKVEDRQERWEVCHERVDELLFRTLASTGVEDAEQHDLRAEPGTIEIMWAPADRPSLSERANAIAQTKGVIPNYLAMTEIWGMDPNMADRAMTQLQEQQAKEAAMAAAAAPKPAGPPGAGQQQQKQGPAGLPGRPTSGRPTGAPSIAPVRRAG